MPALRSNEVSAAPTPGPCAAGPNMPPMHEANTTTSASASEVGLRGLPPCGRSGAHWYILASPTHVRRPRVTMTAAGLRVAAAETPTPDTRVTPAQALAAALPMDWVVGVWPSLRSRRVRSPVLMPTGQTIPH